MVCKIFCTGAPSMRPCPPTPYHERFGGFLPAAPFAGSEPEFPQRCPEGEFKGSGGLSRPLHSIHPVPLPFPILECPSAPLSHDTAQCQAWEGAASGFANPAALKGHSPLELSCLPGESPSCRATHQKPGILRKRTPVSLSILKLVLNFTAGGPS